VITATQQLETYLESFSEFEKLAAGHALPWLRKLRQDAFARFCEVGFPTTHDEDWRFTNVSAIAQTAFRLTRNRRVRLSQQELEPYRVAGWFMPTFLPTSWTWPIICCSRVTRTQPPLLLILCLKSTCASSVTKLASM
jgi:hypothetical protein